MEFHQTVRIKNIPYNIEVREYEDYTVATVRVANEMFATFTTTDPPGEETRKYAAEQALRRSARYFRNPAMLERYAILHSAAANLSSLSWEEIEELTVNDMPDMDDISLGDYSKDAEYRTFGEYFENEMVPEVEEMTRDWGAEIVASLMEDDDEDDGFMPPFWLMEE